MRTVRTGGTSAPLAVPHLLHSARNPKLLKPQRGLGHCQSGPRSAPRPGLGSPLCQGRAV